MSTPDPHHPGKIAATIPSVASSAAPGGAAGTPGSPDGPVEVSALLSQANDSNDAMEDLFVRVTQTASIAARTTAAARLTECAARQDKNAWRIIQAEHPHRTEPRPRQVLTAFGLTALDGVACYFGAQALDGSQAETLVWTGLFLILLAAGEVGLDLLRDRPGQGWRVLAGALTAFVGGLGVLRMAFFTATGPGSLLPAIVGAALLSATTGGFLYLGYRALRMAETTRAWQARRTAQRAARLARAAQATAQNWTAEANRLADAYLCQLRPLLLRRYPVSQQVRLEQEIRDYLLGREER
jgi:hypothetical protein